jgi:hypothetical protein
MDNDDREKEFKLLFRELEASMHELSNLRGASAEYDNSPYDFSITPEPPFCSFCGRANNQVKRMIEGNNSHICGQCVMLCSEIISSEQS